MIEKCRKVLNCVIKCDRFGHMTQNPGAAWCCMGATEWLTVGMTSIVIMNTRHFPQNPHSHMRTAGPRVYCQTP